MAKSKKKLDVASTVSKNKSVAALPNGSFEFRFKFIASHRAKSIDIANRLTTQFIAEYRSSPDLTERENLLLSALAEKQMTGLEWTQLFEEVSRKPKLHQDSMLLVIQLALSKNQAACVLDFCIKGKKEDRNLLLKASSSDVITAEALKMLEKLCDFDFTLWKKYSTNVNWLSTLVNTERAKDVISILVKILNRLGSGGTPKSITKVVLKNAAKQCIETITGEQFRVSMLDYFSPKNFKKDDGTSLIMSISQIEVGSDLQIKLIRAFADAGNSEVIKDTRVWTKVEISSIAEICSHKQIFSVFKSDPKLIERQLTDAVRTRLKGLGLIIQLCDKFPSFAELVDPNYINAIDFSKKPSAIIFATTAKKLVDESNRQNRQSLEALTKTHNTELGSLNDSLLEKESEANLLRQKIRDLESKVAEIRAEKALAKETVIRQARIDALVTVSEIVDEIRVVLEEMEQIDAMTVNNLFRSAMRKIVKLEIQIIPPSDMVKSLDRNLFKVQEEGRSDETFLGRPAYVFSSGGEEFVLLRGVVLKPR